MLLLSSQYLCWRRASTAVEMTAVRATSTGSSIESSGSSGASEALQAEDVIPLAPLELGQCDEQDLVDMLDRENAALEAAARENAEEGAGAGAGPVEEPKTTTPTRRLSTSISFKDDSIFAAESDESRISDVVSNPLVMLPLARF